jgi:hypothetical protein
MGELVLLFHAQTGGCTAALKGVTDDETGESEAVTILGQWGEIPDDFAESLQGG